MYLIPLLMCLVCIIYLVNDGTLVSFISIFNLINAYNIICCFSVIFDMKSFVIV